LAKGWLRLCYKLKNLKVLEKIKKIQTSRDMLEQTGDANEVRVSKLRFLNQRHQSRKTLSLMRFKMFLVRMMISN
jgi:hypothetical protein